MSNAACGDYKKQSGPLWLSDLSADSGLLLQPFTPRTFSLVHRVGSDADVDGAMAQAAVATLSQKPKCINHLGFVLAADAALG